MLLANLALLLATSLLITDALRVRDTILAFLASGILVYAQIVLSSELLSELGLMGRDGYWWLAGIFFVIAAAFWIFRRNHRSTRTQIANAPERLRTSTLLLLGAFTTLYLVALAYPYFVPTFIADAFSYHLPRAYIWLDQGTARHFQTPDFRMVEFPPNSSFIAAWLMALGGVDTPWLHAPQWISALLVCAATFQLSRLCGADRDTALSCAIVVGCLPALLIQAGTTQNDVVIAAISMTAIVFALLYLASDQPTPSALIFAGIAIGLAVGTKLTLAYIIPGIAISSLLTAFTRHSAREAILRLVAIAGAAAMGFVIFGSYNYILNFLTFGHPIYSPHAKSVIDLNYTAANTNGLINLFRYIYQMLDWPGLAAMAEGLGPRLQREALHAIQDLTGLEIFGADAAGRLDEMGQPRVDAESAGFGVVGYLVVMASLPLSICVLTLRAFRPTPAHMLALSFILSAWIFIALVAFTRPWTPLKIRYFILCAPLIVAAVPAILSRAPIFRSYIIPAAALLSLWTGAFVVFYGHNGERQTSWVMNRAIPGRGPVHHVWGGLQANQVEQIRRATRVNSIIGLNIKHDIPVFKLMSELPDRQFRIMSREEISAAIDAETVAAALVTPAGNVFVVDKGSPPSQPVLRTISNAIHHLRTPEYDGSSIGIDVNYMGSMGVIARLLSGREIVPGTASALTERVRSGELNAAILQPGAESSSILPMINDDELWIWTKSAKLLLPKLADLFSMTFRRSEELAGVELGQRAMTTFTGNFFGYWGKFPIPLRLPISVLPEAGDNYTVLVRLEPFGGDDLAVSVLCNDVTIEATVSDDAIGFVLPVSCLNRDPAIQQVWMTPSYSQEQGQLRIISVAIILGNQLGDIGELATRFASTPTQPIP